MHNYHTFCWGFYFESPCSSENWNFAQAISWSVSTVVDAVKIPRWYRHRGSGTVRDLSLFHFLSKLLAGEPVLTDNRGPSPAHITHSWRRRDHDILRWAYRRRRLAKNIANFKSHCTLANKLQKIAPQLRVESCATSPTAAILPKIIRPRYICSDTHATCGWQSKILWKVGVRGVKKSHQVRSVVICNFADNIRAKAYLCL